MLQPLDEVLPDIARDDGLFIDVPPGEDAPPGRYRLGEHHCTTLECTCRAVTVELLHEEFEEPLAVIAHDFDEPAPDEEFLRTDLHPDGTWDERAVALLPRVRWRLEHDGGSAVLERHRWQVRQVAGRLESPELEGTRAERILTRFLTTAPLRPKGRWGTRDEPLVLRLPSPELATPILMHLDAYDLHAIIGTEPDEKPNVDDLLAVMPGPTPTVSEPNDPELKRRRRRDAARRMKKQRGKKGKRKR